MTETVLTVEGLRTHFFTKAGVVKAVDDVSFTVDRGEVLGLVGESGSGKSMTGYSIMGLVDPPGRLVDGRILLDGRDLASLSAEEMRHLRGLRSSHRSRCSRVGTSPARSTTPRGKVTGLRNAKRLP